MPRGDGTGPMGMGPMTGRAAGYCAGFPVPGYMNPIPGRGFWGRGFRGGGRGWRHWYYATGLPGWMRAGYLPAWGYVPPVWQMPPFSAPSKEEMTEALKRQAQFLEESLAEIRERLAELEKESQQK